MKLVEQVFKKGELYKKAGVMLSGLVSDESIQGNLFVSHTKNVSRLLMDMIDNINFSMRDDALKFAASGIERTGKCDRNCAARDIQQDGMNCMK